MATVCPPDSIPRRSGYFTIADRANTGLHIVELTGEAHAIAGLPPLQ